VVLADGGLGAAFAAPDDANRCGAWAQPMPQSDRQQGRVCLTEAHLDCPRYGLGLILRRPEADPAGNRLAGSGATTTAARLILPRPIAPRQPVPTPTESAPTPTRAATPTPAPTPTPTPTPAATAARTTMATAQSRTRAGPAPSRTDSTVLTPAVLAATALLVLSAVASLAFVLIRGGLTLQ
jgi:hypothetical protein